MHNIVITLSLNLLNVFELPFIYYKIIIAVKRFRIDLLNYNAMGHVSRVVLIIVSTCYVASIAYSVFNGRCPVTYVV